MSMKYSGETITNQTRDLPACSAVPQPTVPPHSPTSTLMHMKNSRVGVVFCNPTHTKHSDSVVTVGYIIDNLAVLQVISCSHCSFMCPWCAGLTGALTITDIVRTILELSGPFPDIRRSQYSVRIQLCQLAMNFVGQNIFRPKNRIILQTSL